MPLTLKSPSERWWRSAYFWGALAGLILVPAIRPLTRHVPDPPPVTRPMPAFAATDQQGGAFGSADLKDHVYLASFLATPCDAACETRVAALVKLQQRCRRMGVKLWLVAFSTEPGIDPPGPLGPQGELRTVIERHGGDLGGHPDSRWILLTARDGQLPRFPLPSARGRSVLVDGDGNMRGEYPTDDDGLYEVFHRAQHVMSLRRAWR